MNQRSDNKVNEKNMKRILAARAASYFMFTWNCSSYAISRFRGKVMAFLIDFAITFAAFMHLNCPCVARLISKRYYQAQWSVHG